MKKEMTQSTFSPCGYIRPRRVFPRIANRAILALALIAALSAGSGIVYAEDPPSSGSMPDSQLLAQAGYRWRSRGFSTSIIKVNGESLYVAQAGKGAAVILLHGYPQSGEVWRKVAPELAKSFHVIVPDLRGMGLSEAAAGGYDLTTVSEDIHMLAQSMGLEKVMVVGHDWGGSVGAVYALRHRDEVTRLAFLESALPGAGFEQLWSFTKPNPGFTFIPFLLLGGGDLSGDTTADLLKGRETIYLHHLWATFTGDKVAAPYSDWAVYVAEMARPGISISSSSYYRSAYVSADQVRALIATKLTIPVLSIAGEKGIGKSQDPLVRNFAANLTQAVIVRGGGHFIAEERPSEVTDALKKFLAN